MRRFPADLAAALLTCEEIAARDRSNLYAVSQHLRDRRRYEAFIAMYAVMRVVGDLVDGVSDVRSLVSSQGRANLERLKRWRRRIGAAYGMTGADPGTETILERHLRRALEWAANAFPIPIRTWESFLGAMAHDLDHDRFATLEEFLAYAEGATAAPARIFVLLLCAEPERGRYEVRERGDGFDPFTCGWNLGLFAYSGHILRDVAADLRLGGQGRIYIPLSDLESAGLSEEEFPLLVRSGRSNPRWERLVARLVDRARGFEKAGVEMARRRFPVMSPDCRFILALIIRLYQDLLRRIEANPAAALRGELVQEESERRAILERAVEETGYRPSVVG